MAKDPEKLELFVDGVLRKQPLRRAPPALEARVLARLQAPLLDQSAGELRAVRNDAPWWRRGFAHWPLVARVAFLLASYGFVRIALAGVMYLVAAVRSGEVAGAASPTMTWLHVAGSVLAAATDAVTSVAGAIPPYWLYGAAALGVAFYVALFGLGTVAYRTLYADK